MRENAKNNENQQSKKKTLTDLGSFPRAAEYTHRFFYGLRGRTSLILPPAFSIFVRAEAERRHPSTRRTTSKIPSPKILIRTESAGMSPFFFSVAGVTKPPFGNVLPSIPTFTGAAFGASELNPRCFGFFNMRERIPLSFRPARPPVRAR